MDLRRSDVRAFDAFVEIIRLGDRRILEAVDVLVGSAVRQAMESGEREIGTHTRPA
jgi:hypothetical protein